MEAWPRPPVVSAIPDQMPLPGAVSAPLEIRVPRRPGLQEATSTRNLRVLGVVTTTATTLPAVLRARCVRLNPIRLPGAPAAGQAPPHQAAAAVEAAAVAVPLYVPSPAAAVTDRSDSAFLPLITQIDRYFT